jgi:hypothetical protein
MSWLLRIRTNVMKYFSLIFFILKLYIFKRQSKYFYISTKTLIEKNIRDKNNHIYYIRKNKKIKTFFKESINSIIIVK